MYVQSTNAVRPEMPLRASQPFQMTLLKKGQLQLKVTDEAGNAATAEIKLTREDSQAPQISITIPTKNVIAGVTVTVKDNQLLFDEAVAASWTDDYTTACTVELSLTTTGNTDPQTVKT